jgi:hypothetical protein
MNAKCRVQNAKVVTTQDDIVKDVLTAKNARSAERI